MTRFLIPPDPLANRRLVADGVIHIRFAGLSFDLLLSSLGLSPTTGDELIKRVIARQLVIPLIRLDDFVIDRHANGNMTLRPVASNA